MMHGTTMDQEREAPLEELEAWGYEMEDDEGPIGAATPTLTTTVPCAVERGALLGPPTPYRLAAATPTLSNYYSGPVAVPLNRSTV